MYQRADSILIVTLLITLFSLPVEQADAMSLFHHHNGGGAQPGVSGNVQKPSSNSNAERPSVSTFQSIDAQPYITPIPEPSTVVLLGSGIAALGLWRWKKKQSGAAP